MNQAEFDQMLRSSKVFTEFNADLLKACAQAIAVLAATLSESSNPGWVFRHLVDAAEAVKVLADYTPTTRLVLRRALHICANRAEPLASLDSELESLLQTIWDEVEPARKH
jgi:hypothetical protein